MRRIQQSKRSRTNVLLAATAGLIQIAGIAGVAGAATGTWNGSTDASWTTAGNWNGGVPNATADDAIFYTGTPANLNINANGGTLTVRTLQFLAGANSPVTINVGSTSTGAGTFIVAGQTGDDITVLGGSHLIKGTAG